MQKSSYLTVKMFLILILAATIMNACSLMHRKPPEELLRERVNEMMNARVDLDWGKVYTYFDASYRKSESKESFLNLQRGAYTTAFTIEAIDVQPSGNEALVKMKCDLNMKGFDLKDNSETQNWINEDGQWYLKMKTDKAEKYSPIIGSIFK
jgi:hypothetical protein